jgi:hypothetical protein
LGFICVPNIRHVTLMFAKTFWFLVLGPCRPGILCGTRCWWWFQHTLKVYLKKWHDEIFNVLILYAPKIEYQPFFLPLSTAEAAPKWRVPGRDFACGCPFFLYPGQPTRITPMEFFRNMNPICKLYRWFRPGFLLVGILNVFVACCWLRRHSQWPQWSQCPIYVLYIGCNLNWDWYGYGSISINTIFSGMNIHLPTILMFTRGTSFWYTAILEFHPLFKRFRVYINIHNRKLSTKDGETMQWWMVTTCYNYQTVELNLPGCWLCLARSG